MAERYRRAAASAFASTSDRRRGYGHPVPQRGEGRPLGTVHIGVRRFLAAALPDGTSGTACQFPYAACPTSHRKHAFQVNAPPDVKWQQNRLVGELYSLLADQSLPDRHSSGRRLIT